MAIPNQKPRQTRSVDQILADIITEINTLEASFPGDTWTTTQISLTAAAGLLAQKRSDISNSGDAVKTALQTHTSDLAKSINTVRSVVKAIAFGLDSKLPRLATAQQKTAAKKLRNRLRTKEKNLRLLLQAKVLDTSPTALEITALAAGTVVTYLPDPSISLIPSISWSQS